MRLSKLALCALLVLSGCTGATEPTATETPTATPSPTATPTPTPSPTATAIPEDAFDLNRTEFRDEYATRLQTAGFDLDRAYYAYGELVVKYRTHTENQTEFTREFYRAALQYPWILDSYDGYEPDRVRIWIRHPDGEKMADYTAKDEWARAVNAGEMSQNEYVQRIADNWRV